MPINYSVIINQEEKARLGSFVDANMGRCVRAVSRELEKNLSSVFPEGTVAYADGSKHTLREYTEMLTATTILDAKRNATFEFIRNNPTDLVQVSIEGSSHVGCAVWEGEILSVSGADPNFRSLDEAMGSDGLFHPRCAHSVFPVYNDEFQSSKSQRETNAETIIGNVLRAASLQKDQAAAIAYIANSGAKLKDKFEIDLTAKAVGENEFKIEAGAIILKNTGEKVLIKSTKFSMIPSTDEDEIDPFYHTPFRKGSRQ